MWSAWRIGTAAAIATVIGSGAAPAAADTVFQAQTAATASHFVLTQEPASSIVTASLVDDAAGYAASAFDSTGGSEGQAATFYPGNLVVQGPALFCSQLFPCPAQPPAYPLLADASYPRRTSDAAAGNAQPIGSGPFVVTPATAVAHASSTGNDGASTTGGSSLLAGTPAATDIGTSTASTRVTSTAASLVVHVESVATDIDLAGIVHIGAVHAVCDTTISATGRITDKPHLTVSGVTVAGQPATIDESGIHVAGTDGPSLAQQVAQHGVTIHTVGVHKQDGRALARSDATGLEVDLSAPVSGAPYVPNPLQSYPPFDQIPGVNANGTYIGRLTLGAVGVVAGANAQPTFSLGGLAPLTSGTTRTASGVAPPATSAAQTAAALPAQAPQVSAPGGFFRAVLDGFTTDIGDIYAVLALGSASLFIGWRGIVAVRRRSQVGRG